MTTSRLTRLSAAGVATGVLVLVGTAAGADTGDLVANPTPPPPVVSMVAPDVIEGTGSSTTMVVELTLDSPASGGEWVRVFTMDGQGSADPVADHAPVLETVVFGAGDTAATVDIPIVPDAIAEAHEHVLIGMDNPVGVAIDGDTTSGVILDDDRPVMSIGDVTMDEGDTGSQLFEFPVTLSHPSTVDVYAFATPVAGTATADSDFWGTTPLLVEIPAGSTQTTVSILVQGDADLEPDETFTVELADLAYADLGDGTAVGTIVDDDAPGNSGGAPGQGLGNGNGGNSAQAPPTAQHGSSFPPYFLEVGGSVSEMADAVLRLVFGG